MYMQGRHSHLKPHWFMKENKNKKSAVKLLFGNYLWTDDQTYLINTHTNFYQQKQKLKRIVLLTHKKLCFKFNFFFLFTFSVFVLWHFVIVINIILTDMEKRLNRDLQVTMECLGAGNGAFCLILLSISKTIICSTSMCA